MDPTEGPTADDTADARVARLFRMYALMAQARAHGADPALVAEINRRAHAAVDAEIARLCAQDAPTEE